MYDPRQFALRENVPESHEAEARKGLAGYYGLCSALDRQMGRLLKTLDEEGLARDTIVVFTADHGDMLGSQGLDFKNEPYEESARIPLLMRYPRLQGAGGHNSMLLSNVDYMPTFLGLCGAEIPDGVQGLDHSELLLTGKGKRPESIFAEGKMAVEAEWRMVVRGDEKMVIDRQGEVTHLYNLSNDPFEMNNLKGAREQRLTRDSMMALLNDWRKRTGDGRSGSGLRSRG